jgi:hypothetical protein
MRPAGLKSVEAPGRAVLYWRYSAWNNLLRGGASLFAAFRRKILA